MNIDETYLYLPKEFHKMHDACFRLVGEIEQFAIYEKYHPLKHHAISITKEELDQFNTEGGDVLSFLKNINKQDDHDKFVKNFLINGLIVDNCYYLQEALMCSKKMRLAVAYSLLRRPLVYNMVIFLRLLLEDNFMSKFISGEEDNNIFDIAKLPKNLKDILANSTNHLITQSTDGGNIYELVFDKANPSSIINMSEKALHPVTTRNKANSTGMMNLNFVFLTKEDNYNLWGYLYKSLLYILMYYVDLIDSVTFPQLESLNFEEEIKERLNNRSQYLAEILADFKSQ